MKCVRLRLAERSKPPCKPTTGKLQRYCQKRLVNPDHDEDPRWTDVLQRFHCNTLENINYNETFNNTSTHQDYEDLFLSVQNLKFQGDEQRNKRPRTSFKYKTVTDGKKHRMFVKQMVPEPDEDEEDCSSQLTGYYFDDYAKYLNNTDPSRPSSGKSNIYKDLNTKLKENKSTQAEVEKYAKSNKIEFKTKSNDETTFDYFENEGNKGRLCDSKVDNTKIAFHKSGKRRSLTISRAPSPETVQVIRVEVICNYSSCSTLSDYEDTKKQMQTNSEKMIDKIEHLNERNNFVNKYLLTNTIKTLDERVSGGDKVTLLCKTFRLSDRSKMSQNKKSVNVVRGKLQK